MMKKEQDVLYKELINGRQNRSRGYTIRLRNIKADILSVNLCMHSFLNLFEIVRKRFNNLSKNRFLPGKNKHNNKGNSFCALSQEVFDSVMSFIIEKGKYEGGSMPLE
jgi:hypothetical protein